MENSILNSVKKVLGIDASYQAFDEDIIMHVNSAFATLNQLGLGPAAGYQIVDESATWDAFIGSDLLLNSVKSYIYLKLRLIFDPPQTSYHLESIKEQIRELEFRLNVKREGESWVDPYSIETP